MAKRINKKNIFDFFCLFAFTRNFEIPRNNKYADCPLIKQSVIQVRELLFEKYEVEV